MRVRNIVRFQHYKDRDPPWIKWYLKCVKDYDFATLPDGAKWHAVGLVMLEAQTGGQFPADPVWIASQIAATTTVELKPLLDIGFLEHCDPPSCEQVASKPLADAGRNGVPPSDSPPQSTENRDQRADPPKPPTECDRAFDTWWSPYPKKIRKVKVKKLWDRLWKAGKLPNISAMLAKLDEQKRSRQWLDEGGRFAPHPYTYLNGGQWEDEVELAEAAILQPGSSGDRHNAYMDELWKSRDEEAARLASEKSKEPAV